MVSDARWHISNVSGLSYVKCTFNKYVEMVIFLHLQTLCNI